MALTCIPVYNLESYEYLDGYFQKFMSQFYEICKGYIFSYEILQEDLLAWKVYYRISFLFFLSRMFHWMNKFLITENRKAVKVFALYLPKFLSLEYVKYKNPPTECRQRINYAID